VRWETKRSFDGKLCPEYQKLSKSVNWLLSYSRKCQGYFFADWLRELGDFAVKSPKKEEKRKSHLSVKHKACQ